jgi:K+-sensing histidine kinase KdpD
MRAMAQRSGAPGGTAGRQGPVAAASPASRGDDDIMARLVNESVEQSKHGCPNCHSRMKANQAICVNCGFNRETGKVLKTVEQKAVVIKEKRAKGSGRNAAIGATNGFMGALFSPYVVLCTAALLLGGGFLYAQQDPQNNAVFFLLAVFIVSIMTIVTLAIDAYSEGIVKLLFAIFTPYGLYYTFVESDSGTLKALYAMNFVGSIAGNFMLSNGMAGP